jgi:hypothetical protein
MSGKECGLLQANQESGVSVLRREADRDGDGQGNGRGKVN